MNEPTRIHSQTDRAGALHIAVLTVSDSRTSETDSSGALLVERLQNAGHHERARVLLPDNRYAIRARVADWIADERTQVVLISGGTGLSERDGTPEAVEVLLDKKVEGFGERFRALSAAEIGSSTLQSRCLAGLANGTLVVCLPGSTGACRLAWDALLAEQLDADHRPCNFVAHLKQADTAPCPGRS